MARLLFTARDFGSLTESNHQSTLHKFVTTNSIWFMRQNHGNNFQIITNKDGSPGVNRTDQEVDALITAEPGISLAVMVADCLPVLIDGSSVVAAVHVGRRGLMNEITLKVLQQMQQMNAQINSISVGPHICGNCYPLDEATAKSVWLRYPSSNINAGKPANNSSNCADLFAGLQDQVHSFSKKLQLQRFGGCTFEKLQYFSHRASGDLGRQAGVISL